MYNPFVGLVPWATNGLEPKVFDGIQVGMAGAVMAPAIIGMKELIGGRGDNVIAVQPVGGIVEVQLPSKTTMPYAMTVAVPLEYNTGWFAAIAARELSIGVGTGIKLVWPKVTADDCVYITLYTDYGNPATPLANFSSILTEYNRDGTSYVFYPPASGTFRFYMLATDIYGNEESVLDQNVMEITLTLRPLVVGTFEVSGRTVTFTASTNTGKQLCIFCNYLHGFGRTDTVNTANPLAVSDSDTIEFEIPFPSGQANILACCRDEYGNLSEPVALSLEVSETDAAEIEVPDYFVETLAAGYFALTVKSDNGYHFTELTWYIWDGDTQVATGSQFAPNDLFLEYAWTLFPDIDDGDYEFSLVVSDGSVESQTINDRVALRIDATAPDSDLESVELV